MNSRLAVLGGMFDPVHNGHIEAAQFALRTLSLDCLKMIPCHIPNHKNLACAPSHHRLAMLEIATSHLAQLDIDPIELNREGHSYTVDTLAELKRDHATVVFVLGADSFNSLPQWHRWEMVLELCHLLVLARPGSALSPTTKSELRFDARVVNSSEELFATSSGKIIYKEEFQFAIASTSIREQLVDRPQELEGLNKQVGQYIRDNHLYQEL